MSETASNPRVAVDVLLENQRDILFRGAPDRDPSLTPLVDAFDDRWDIITWWQAASVRTFGYLSGFFPATRITAEDHLADILIGADTAAEEKKRAVLVEKVTSATKTAYRDLEVRASEWLSSDHGDDDFRHIDPTEQQHLAMRPAFSRLDANQAAALSELRGGFDSRTALVEWAHSLPGIADIDATAGAPLPDLITQNAHTRAMLLDEPADAQAYRERFAATTLLPAFGYRARTLRAGERPETERADRTVPHG